MFSPSLITHNYSDHSTIIPGTKSWLKQLDQIIDQHPGNPTLNNELLAEALRVSERDLFRKVKKVTGLSPQRYLRQYRLKEAMKFMIIGKYKTVKETAHAVGYTKVSYFITQFEKEFGRTPLKILKENGWR